MTREEYDAIWNRRDALSEQDWLTCPDPRPLAAFIESWFRDTRKYRLWAVAGCRRLWAQSDPAGHRRSVNRKRRERGSDRRGVPVEDSDRV